MSYYFYSTGNAENAISPEVFQSFNPLFIVALTFPVMGFFNWLNKKNMEPSTPRKIGYGMIIAAIGFTLVLISAWNLVSLLTWVVSLLPIHRVKVLTGW
ncbi:MAG: hypothetical protein U0Z17_07170 [Bacteroidales bacterium]